MIQSASMGWENIEKYFTPEIQADNFNELVNREIEASRREIQENEAMKAYVAGCPKGFFILVATPVPINRKSASVIDRLHTHYHRYILGDTNCPGLQESIQDRGTFLKTIGQ